MTAVLLATIFTTFIVAVNQLFSLLAGFFEDNREAGSWHRDLLRRMTLEINYGTIVVIKVPDIVHNT